MDQNENMAQFILIHQEGFSSALKINSLHRMRLNLNSKPMPDILAIKNGQQYIVEAKFWNTNNRIPTISNNPKDIDFIIITTSDNRYAILPPLKYFNGNNYNVAWRYIVS